MQSNEQAAARVRDFKARQNLIPYSDPADVRRRTRLERAPAQWLAFYLSCRFSLRFGDVHHQIIEACLRAMTEGTSLTVAAPRGFGKTSILWGMALFGALTGKSRFPVVIGWKAAAGNELLDQWLYALSHNERLRADYPCQCAPFWESTASQRLKRVLRELSPKLYAGCDVRKGRGTVILPDVVEPTTGVRLPHVALAGASVCGSIKGLNVGLQTGEALRPDIVLIDDPQDTATAESEQLVNKTIRRIDYNIRSLSGPRRRLTVLAAVTCIEPGDVSAHLLQRPGVEAIKISQISTWPTDWHNEKSATRIAWEAWNRERLAGIDEKDGGKRARAYYRLNKAILTEGFTVSWSARYQARDGIRTADPDSMYAAMWDYYDLGEMVFAAERQNEPIKEGVTVFELRPKVIMARADPEREPGVVPDWGRIVLAATDINPSYGLTTVIATFGVDQRAAVLWYGKHDLRCANDLTDAQKKAAIMSALQTHGQYIARLPCRPVRWIIDGGGSPQDTVITFAETATKTCGIEAICAFGRAWRMMRAKQSDRCHEQSFIRAESRTRQWAIWNVDYWKEIAQKSWLAAVGAPGSCDMPRGHHIEFAEHICREQLAGKAETAGTWVYVWRTLPGPHDYGDCMAMLYALAGICGFGTGGRIIKRRYVEARKCKFQRTD